MALYFGTDRVSTTIVNTKPSIPLEVSSQGVLQKRTTPFTWKSQGDFLTNQGLVYSFFRCTGLTSADLSSLTRILGSGLEYTFSFCTNLTNVDLSNLTLLSDNALKYTFESCTSLTSVDLSSLTTLTGIGAMQNAFYGCTSLATLSFPSLTSTSFGSYTNQFNNMLQSVTGCTVHFPSNLQSVIGSWSSVTNGFGGTSTTVLFDLPATT